jgi:predicted RNase H-like nuclease (RuvC/YqgF family)
MCVAIHGMEGSGLLEASQATSKPLKAYTGIEDQMINLKSQAFHDGLVSGRYEGQEQIKSLQEEQELLMKIVASKTETTKKLSYDLQQARDNFELIRTEVRTIALRLQDLAAHTKSFREKPAAQLEELQKSIEELKKIAK